MSDFVILKKFKVNIHPPKAPVIKEVFWCLPLQHWIKGNTDGASTSISSACGVIFRNSDADMLLCLAKNLGSVPALHAELMGAMRAIEISFKRGWRNFWLESDSSMVVLAFKNVFVVPWTLRNRWFNCTKLTSQMNFVVTHIFREGNQCADRLANLGLSIQGVSFWNIVPAAITSHFVCNKLGRPSFRFVSF